MSESSDKTIFEKAARENLWGDPDSKSGTGSNLFQTRIIREVLPGLIEKYGIKSMLDAPCGDFFWMKEIIGKITAGGCLYTGADIVADLVNENTDRYGGERVRFLQLNLVEDSIPQVDLIFTRDCFIHLSFMNIYRVLKNYKASGSKYILVSTYTGSDRENSYVSGFYLRGRALNMQKFPFYFPQPMTLINEGCTEGEGANADKSLALWKLEEIRLMPFLLNARIGFFVHIYRRIWNKIYNLFSR